MTARTRLGLLTALATATLLPFASAANAAEGSPWWHLTQRVIPSRIEPGGKGTIVLQALNLGNASTSGRFDITDNLPSGLTLKHVAYRVQSTTEGSGVVPADLGPSGPFAKSQLCETSPTRVSCSSESPHSEAGFVKPLLPYEYVELRLTVKDEGASPGELNESRVGGGGGRTVVAKRPVPISETPAGFGVEELRLVPEAEGGEAETHAGAHPYQLTTTVSLNRDDPTNALRPPAPLRNLHFLLPPGQLANVTAMPQCNGVDFGLVLVGPVNACPDDTAIGVIAITIATTATEEESIVTVPLFNLVPARGEPARFGFLAAGSPVVLDTALRSGLGEDYGATVSTENTTELVNFIASTAVFWGAPADPSHNAARGWGCLRAGFFQEHGAAGPCEPSSAIHPLAFLMMPTGCAAPFATTLAGDSWPVRATPESSPESLRLAPLTYSLADEAGELLPLVACNQVPFDPRVHAEPTSNASTSPTGLNIDLNFTDSGLSSATGVAQSQIKKAVVTLPEGFTTNPSVAEGLHACTEAQFDSETVESPPGASCPNSSNIGAVEIESPLVKQKVIGALYVAQQHQNPNSNLLTLYLVAKNPEVGILIKQALKVTPDPVTGQLTTEVDNVPQLPFSHFHLSFRQGQRSPLITPPACGTYTVEADLYPWSNPSAPVHRESSFQITQGPEGQGCPNGVPPFHPNLEAGTLNNAAGTYSPFVTKITRRDSEQEITHFSIKLPPGVVGKLAGIPFCPEAGILAAEGREHEGGGEEELQSPSCPQASEVGHTLVGSGVGNVLAYAPGKLYLAGPYNGAPISIVSITAAKVGPFDLGTVVVREALKVNPETAEVFVDATGSDPIPHIVDGIPVHLRDIRIYVNRPEFVLNPTSCEPTSTASTVLGSGLNFASEADDVPVTVTSPFQAADCAALPFGPRLGLKLLGATKRTGHPALKATLHMNGIGEAAIARSQVTLPKSEFLDQGHLNNICTRVQFKEGNGNGEKCPPASVYGHARAVTPILSEPLEGPVYLRSSEHQLPDLVAALHGSEINVDLVGRIDSLHGQIRNTFEAVPDAPVTSFTLEMQGGAKGLLINSTNLCQGKHRAIVDFTGHNGKISDTTPAVGARCPKPHKKAKHRTGKRKHKRAHRQR